MILTKEILNQIGIYYDNIELTKITALKNYGEFLCDIIDSNERHTAAIGLHTGSVYYQAMAVSVAAIGCLFYRNTNIAELIESLNIGDKLIIDGQRVIFKGVEDGIVGIGFNPGDKYFILECNNGQKRWISLEKASELNMSLYQGGAESLGGRGIRSTLKYRKDFLSAFSTNPEISTEINQSIAVLVTKNMAEQLYRGIYFLYGGKKIALSEIVTATYYTSEDFYQIGNNPTKEEPILKFFSNVSTCRDTIMDDKQNRIIGCIVADENMWVFNSEIHDIVDRKSLKYALMLGRSHYTKFKNWYESDLYKLYAIVPETTQNLLDENEFLPWMQGLKEEIISFSQRNISNNDIQSRVKLSVVCEIKKRLLKIQKECMEDNEKEDFLMESYFLLNLCRSAFFPLLYCDKANEKKILSWTLTEKLQALNNYATSLIGELKEDVKFICDNIAKMVFEIYHSNPKGEIIRNKLINREVDYIVATKLYYKDLFSLWIDDCKLKVQPKIVTLSSFEKNQKVLVNVIFTTSYYNSLFNPYASFGFKTAEVLLYEYEKHQAQNLIRDAERGRNLLKEKNTITYDIIEQPKQIELTEENRDDNMFENIMDKMANGLSVKRANRYISTLATSGGTAKVEKVFTFASGSVGYFTKYYKGYAIYGDKVIEVDLDNLKVGDNMVFTKQCENKDIVDLLLNQLLENQYRNTKYPEYYYLSTEWKKELRRYRLMQNLTYSQLADQLKCFGCVKHLVTIRVWLDETSYVVGPRELSDYEAIVKLLKLEKSPLEIKKGCDEIRALRTKILDTLGKAIIRGMSTGEKDSISDFICEKAENLSQIEQITGIISSDMDATVPTTVPMYMVNKPLNMEEE